MARRPNSSRRRVSSRGEFINGKFVTYRELAEDIDRGYEHYLRSNALTKAKLEHIQTSKSIKDLK